MPMFDYIDARIHIDTDSMQSFGCPEVCAFCKYSKHIKHNDKDSHWACFGQKDMPTIENPLRTTCMGFKPEYEIELKEKEPTEENKMGVDLIKDVKIIKKVFDRDFWIPGDIYVIENTKDNLRFMCVLIKFEQGDTRIRVWVNDQGYMVFWSEQIGETYKVVNHITRDSILEYRNRCEGSDNIK